MVLYFSNTKLQKSSQSDIPIELNARNIYGMTPFLVACAYGHTNVVHLLLDYHDDKIVDLNARSNNGMTAFMLACNNGHKDVVKLLLKSSEIRSIDTSEPNNLSRDMKDFIDLHQEKSKEKNEEKNKN